MPETTAEALIFEREGYERRGLKDRVAQVDDQLAALGFRVGDAEPSPTFTIDGTHYDLDAIDDKAELKALAEVLGAPAKARSVDGLRKAIAEHVAGLLVLADAIERLELARPSLDGESLEQNTAELEFLGVAVEPA